MHRCACAINKHASTRPNAPTVAVPVHVQSWSHPLQCHLCSTDMHSRRPTHPQHLAVVVAAGGAAAATTAELSSTGPAGSPTTWHARLPKEARHNAPCVLQRAGTVPGAAKWPSKGHWMHTMTTIGTWQASDTASIAVLPQPSCRHFHLRKQARRDDHKRHTPHTALYTNTTALRSGAPADLLLQAPNYEDVPTFVPAGWLSLAAYTASA